MLFIFSLSELFVLHKQWVWWHDQEILLLSHVSYHQPKP